MLTLDVGCATGRVIQEMHRYAPGTTFIGLDISSSMIQLAKIAVPNDVEFVVGDIRNLPFHDACFDFVYTLEVVEHLDNKVESIPKSLSEVTRIAAKRGSIVLESTSLYHFRVQELIRKAALSVFSSRRRAAPLNVIPKKFREIYLRAPLLVAEPSALHFIVRSLERGSARVKSIYWVRVIPEFVFTLVESHKLRGLLITIDEAFMRLPVLRYLGREFIILSEKAN